MDRAARNDLIVAHYPLVRSIARRIDATTPNTVTLDDLVSHGVIGLIDAIGKFDPDRGATLGTYARRRIRGAILDGLRHDDWLPRSVRAAVKSGTLPQPVTVTPLDVLDTDDEPASTDSARDLERVEARVTIARLLPLLPEREWIAVTDHYYAGKTLREIGEAMRVTESRVCQLLAQAMRRLRAQA